MTPAVSLLAVACESSCRELLPPLLCGVLWLGNWMSSCHCGDELTSSLDCCFSGARLKVDCKQIPSRELLTLKTQLVPRSLAVLQPKRGEVQSVGLMHEITGGTCLLWMKLLVCLALWYNRHIGWRRILLFKIFIYLFWLS